MHEVVVKRLEDSPSEKFLVESTLRQLEFRRSEDSIVEIEVVGPSRMRSINNKFRNIDSPTDVLSFPAADFPTVDGEGKILGTIFLCSDIIKKNSRCYGKTFEEEFDFMLRHGVDHLLGFHHK